MNHIGQKDHQKICWYVNFPQLISHDGNNFCTERNLNSGGD